MLKILAVIVGTVLFVVDCVDASGRVHVRVVGGKDNCTGRVEVYFAHQWSTVCDKSWSQKDAHVVCRELGCGPATASPPANTLGGGHSAVWHKEKPCSGDEYTLAQCSGFRIGSVVGEEACSDQNTARVQCLNKLKKPTLSLLSAYTAYLPGEAVRFSCTAPPSPNSITDFHLLKSGARTALVTQGNAHQRPRAELMLSHLDVSYQGRYMCVYTVFGFSSPESNSIHISVVDLYTPQIWYNTSTESLSGRVIRGHSLNITCSAPSWYPGSSFQLQLIRSNGTVRHSVAAPTPSFTFSFPSAQAPLEGYYRCLYQVQMGGRVFTTRESQPLPISIRDPEPLLSPMALSWLVSAATFVVAVSVILITVWIRSKREKTTTELERDNRTCVDNTYVALPIK